MSTVEIRDYLNDNGHKPPRTNTYSTSLVWVTLKKLKQRRDRINSDAVIDVTEHEVEIYGKKR